MRGHLFKVLAFGTAVHACTPRTSDSHRDSPAVAASVAASAISPPSALPASAAEVTRTTLDGGPPAPQVATRASILDDCKDPRAVLAIRKEFDRTGRSNVQQFLVATPSFKVVAERAAAPMEVDFYETIYGPSRFKSQYRGDPLFNEAVIARCADTRTCQSIADEFHAAFPSERPLLTCGVPPATTGGFKRVPELAVGRLTLPAKGSARAVYCARIHACAPRPRSESRPSATCAELESELLRCAQLEDCQAVSECAAKVVP